VEENFIECKGAGKVTSESQGVYYDILGGRISIISL
jgi:hypothetical protein